MGSRHDKTAALDLAAQADSRAPLDGATFLRHARALLTELEADLFARAEGSVTLKAALVARHRLERASRRTADAPAVWEHHFVTQVAASWLLSCAFVRTLEDRGLWSPARIGGPGAQDSELSFFEQAPALSERDYLLDVFRELSRYPAARPLFDSHHNPVWLLGPSNEMARKLVALFRAPSAEATGLRSGGEGATFLGDLYQGLSEDTTKRFALLQTPRFVEQYILDQTLERAIQRFGLADTTLIDPTCGSGNFLLGAFERLFDHRLRGDPALDVREAARLALDAVHGVDINPYAAAIARFRLVLAFLEKAGYSRLADAPEPPLHVFAGDSLLQEPEQTRAKDPRGEALSLEDEPAVQDVLHRTFAAVVGHPPHVTVKDAALRERYRETYPRSAAGKYSAAAPFIERFFQLARSGGFVGLIATSSFMVRQFGKRLIEDYLPTVNLDTIISTAGAYLPGHGTPTVLLFGSAEPPAGDEVLVVRGKRGEPEIPVPAELGLVWKSIVEHGREPGFENDYISVARVARATLSKHPWSLAGGGAAELKELLEERAQSRLDDLVADIGFASITGQDDIFVLPEGCGSRLHIPAELLRPMVGGDSIRDWNISSSERAITPYDPRTHQPLGLDTSQPWARFLWRYRRIAESMVGFGGKTRKETGEKWWLWSRWHPERYAGPFRICFAAAATHNNLALDRGGNVFGRTAPVIRLAEGSTEEDYLAVLAYLNSSTACFWMKQVMAPKGVSSAGRGDDGEDWGVHFELDGSKVALVPVPRGIGALAAPAKEMLALAQQRSACDPTSMSHHRRTSTERVDLEAAREQEMAILAKMVALQEKIDFEVYRLFGLIDSIPELPGNIPPGSRAFEAQLVRDGTPTAWFTRHDHELPGPGAPALDDLRVPPEVRLIEQPAFKRRWISTDWPEEVAAASRRILLDLVERRFAEGPAEIQPGSVLARSIGESELARWLEEEAVPFGAAHRHTRSGLEKRAAWERTWDMQRTEDRGEDTGEIPVPPRYDARDYRDPIFWRLRGKLDVPRERFISYPGCESDQDGEPVFGWAGWSHLQQAQALAGLYQHRKTMEGWSPDRLAPMLAGLLELLPWVKQWHDEPSPDFGWLRMGEYFETLLNQECQVLGITRDDLRASRPGETPARDAALRPFQEGDGLVRRLRVSHFRSLGGNVDIRFGKLTALVGQNGAGKTNTIDALVFLGDCMHLGLDQAIRRRGGFQMIRHAGSSGRSSSVSIAVEIASPEMVAEYEIVLTARGSRGYSVRREHVQVQRGDQRSFFRMENGVWAGPPDIRPAVDETSLVLPRLTGDKRFGPLAGALRSIAAYSISPEVLRTPQKYDPALPMDRYGANWASILKNQEEESWKPDLITVLDKLTGDVIDAKIEPAGGLLVVRFKHLAMVGESKREHWLDARVESDGTLRVAGMITALKQQPRPGVIALEEPELTVHPGAVEVLHDYIREASDNGQIILTTHSPDLLSLLSDDEVRVVERMGAETAVAPLDDGQREVVRRGLFSLGEVMRTEGLLPQRPADRGREE